MVDAKIDKLSKCIVLFDDGRHYLVKGEYQEETVLVQGWHRNEAQIGSLNQGEDLGSQIVPKFLEKPLLVSALKKLKRQPDIPNNEKFVKAIKNDLKIRE